MLNVDDYRIRDFDNLLGRDEGNSGKIFLFTSKKDKNISYVVKDEWGHSVNEYVGQQILKALGFNSLPVEFVRHGHNKYGAVRYREGLKRVYLNTAELTSDQRNEIIELFILNNMLDNCDPEGEYYLDQDGVVYMLDFGEAIISPIMFKSYMFKEMLIKRGASPHEQQFDDFRVSATRRMENAIDYYLENLLVDGRITKDAFLRSVESILHKIVNLDLNAMQQCFDEIEQNCYSGASNYYRQRLEWMKIVAEEYCKNRRFIR